MADESNRITQVRIFGRNYTIEWPLEIDGGAHLGMADRHHLKIMVKQGQLPIEEADTFLHEILHSIDYVMDIKLSEHAIRAMATGIIGVFQDNPDLVKYFADIKS